MAEQEKPKRSRKRNLPSLEIPLEQERDGSLGLTLFHSQENINITPEQKFVVMPGEKGHGWVLRIYS